MGTYIKILGFNTLKFATLIATVMLIGSCDTFTINRKENNKVVTTEQSISPLESLVVHKQFKDEINKFLIETKSKTRETSAVVLISLFKNGDDYFVLLMYNWTFLDDYYVIIAKEKGTEVWNRVSKREPMNGYCMYDGKMLAFYGFNYHSNMKMIDVSLLKTDKPTEFAKDPNMAYDGEFWGRIFKIQDDGSLLLTEEGYL